MKRLNNITVLVVEDDPLVARAVGRWLSRHGAEVTIANTVSAGMNELSAEHGPAAVVTDYHLGDGTGETIARRCAVLSTPCFMLTGSSREAKAQLKGVPVSIISKPPKLNDLVDQIATAVEVKS